MRHARSPFRHSFIITREDGQRIFGYALLFPEEVHHPGVKATLRSAQENTDSSVTVQPEFKLKPCDRIFSMKVGLVTASVAYFTVNKSL